MRFSNSFIPVQREVPRDTDCVSHALTLRAGLAVQVAAGHYSILPIGMRVLNKIENIIRAEMDRAGAVEISMPIMQPAVLWQESQRWDIYGQEMFKLKSRTSREFCLGPTHEELVVATVRGRIKSYRDLPFNLYQFGTKFRDEARPRGGLLRAREFLMKDAYSFDINDEAALRSYAAMYAAYTLILHRLGVNAMPINANPGEVGGGYSQEFIAPSDAGEDEFFVDAEGVPHKRESVEELPLGVAAQKGIEIGHIFKLGTRYSEAMGLRCPDDTGRSVPLVMGCYGIGVSRMLPCVLEQHHDEKGIVWPTQIRPFDICIVPIGYANNDTVRSTADELYNMLSEHGVEVLLDDRDVAPGVKFHDADLLGAGYKLVVGARGLQRGIVECEARATGERSELRTVDVLESMRHILNTEK